MPEGYTNGVHVNGTSGKNCRKHENSFSSTSSPRTDSPTFITNEW